MASCIVAAQKNDKKVDERRAVAAGPIASTRDFQLFDRASIKRQSLDPNSKTRLETAKNRHERNIPFILASRHKRNSEVAALLKRLGGEAVFQADDVDYIRGLLPTAEAEHFAADHNIIDISLGEGAGPAPLLDQHEALQTPAARFGPDKFLPAIEPNSGPGPSDPDSPVRRNWPLYNNPHGRPDASGRKHLPQKALPINELAAINPYMPTYLLGAPQFIGQHPNFDGRGVTIAFIGGVSDLDHPMLQQGRMLDGKITSKVVDILDPSPINTGIWSSVLSGDLSQVIVGQDAKFVYESKNYFAPKPGRYRFGILQSRAWVKHPLLLSGIAVLWDETQNLVWLDTNFDRDFRNDPPITDFELWNQIVRIPGADDGFTASLCVKTFPHEHVLKVFPYSDHETSVASVAAGNAFLGSQATGVAPGARILHVAPSSESIVESYLFAARDPRVDIISASFDPDISVEGEDVASQILNGIIQRYQKTIVKATGNGGAVLNSVYGMACPVKVLAIGCYATRASESANWTSPYIADEEEYVYAEGGSGPSGLGAIKPDLIAPSPNSRATPCALMDESRSAFVPLRCYSLGGGQSSMAAPMAAGALALLISGAKQTGLPYTDERLRYALLSSARHLQNWPVDRQGGGAIQVGPAWEQLKALAHHEPTKILASARISFSGSYNKTPGYGVGIYETEGWHRGDTEMRELVVYRTNGPTNSRQYDISWIGNDSTFSAPPQIGLGLRSPVSIPIQIEAREPGIHSALLRLTESKGGEFAGQFGMTVLVAEQLRAENEYTVTVPGNISRDRSGRVFVDIPSNAESVDIAVDFIEGKGDFSIWKNTLQLKCSEESNGRCRLLEPRPGAIQILITGTDDQSPNSLLQQQYKVTVQGKMRGLGK